MGAQRSYGGRTADERRTQRRAAFLAAALDIVGTSGHARLTVGRLCSAAGLNERYFYENFAAVSDVLVAVFDDVMAELTEAIVSAVAEAADDPRAKAHAAIAAAVHLLTEDPRKTRIVFVEPLAVPELNARRTEVSRTFVDLVVAQAQEFYGPRATLRAGSWTDFAAAYLVGGLAETMTAWLRADLSITREELITRATDLFVLVGDYVINEGTAG